MNTPKNFYNPFPTKDDVTASIEEGARKAAGGEEMGSEEITQPTDHTHTDTCGCDK